MAKQAKAPVTAVEAIKIIDRVVPMIGVDVRRGIETMELMEAGNKPVSLALAGVQARAIRGHGTVQNALMLTTALAMSRVFDLGSNRPIEQQNKASLPLLAHYLGRQDVEQVLLSRAPPHSGLDHAGRQAAISTFRNAWSMHLADEDMQDALRRLRLFRDYFVAHSLFDIEPAAPTYNELFQIITRAADLLVIAEGASGHEPTFFADFREDRAEFSAEFWGAFVVGVKASLS